MSIASPDVSAAVAFFSLAGRTYTPYDYRRNGSIENDSSSEGLFSTACQTDLFCQSVKSVNSGYPWWWFRLP